MDLFSPLQQSEKMVAVNRVFLLVGGQTEIALHLMQYQRVGAPARWQGAFVDRQFPNLTIQRLNGHNIVFRTNFLNGMNSSTVASVVVRPDDLIGDRPIIEFTCTDNTFTSSPCIVYDVLR